MVIQTLALGLSKNKRYFTSQNLVEPKKKYEIRQEQLDLLRTSDSKKALPSDPCDGSETLIDPESRRTKKNNDTSQVPSKLLIVDTETTGLNPVSSKCLEVGAILFHVESRSVLSQQSFLLPVDKNDAEFINRIPAEITQIVQPWNEGLQYLTNLIEAADVLVAHNSAFDKKWFEKDPLPKISKPWICSMEDIAWPLELHLSARPSMRDLALAFGVPVWAAHRALTDCIYLAEVFSRCEQ